MGETVHLVYERGNEQRLATEHDRKHKAIR
jgi:hypothetical protein